MSVRQPTGRYLSPAEAKRFYYRLGSRQDWQGFYENPAINLLIAHAAFDSAQSVFEFGCGTGSLAARLLQGHLPADARYVGLDISSTMVSLARERLKPNEWSVFIHIDKMYPKGLGSLFAKQFVWKPESLDHGQYSLDISASTGRFHEDLFVEKTNGKYTNAARVEEIDTKRTLFVCRDRSFPKSLAPTIVAKNNCFPNWIAR